MFFPRLVLAARCLTSLTLGATLASDEVEALKIIGKTLGKTNWNFDVDPCSGDNSWEEKVGNPKGSYNNTVTCDCNFNNNTSCHVVAIFLTGQNLSGALPPELVKLPFLHHIYIGGTGLSGPIPNVSGLENIKYIIINDLNGAEATFPQFINLPKLERLILRSCNFIGRLPDSLGALTSLKILDVSFNRFTGDIPNALSALTKLDQMFLTGNMFTGPLPPWIRNAVEEIDVSYNNFTSTGASGCKQNSVNLFASTSRTNNSGIVSCLSNTTCPAEPLRSLHINCGGRQETVNGTTYEADEDGAGPSAFFLSPINFWTFSSTGLFLGDDRFKDIFVVGNAQLSISAGKPYRTARLSSSSLTYYVFCLDQSRTYNVDLHFAEIQFTDDQNFSSLGGRIFDVYIQGKRELKDFNIKEEAGGAGKPIVKHFNVTVRDGTLEIRLQWAGKGTTCIPVKGVYGPLISAISVVHPDYKPPSSGGGISAGAIVGIVAGAAFAIFLIVGTIWWNCRLRQKSTLEQDLKGIDLHTSSFTLRQIKAATGNFDAANKIGEGGFGPVYKGTLEDGTLIAVKQLSARSQQGNREFVTEIGMISALQHPHLVKLYGCCSEGNQLLLIYEYLQNNSLHRALFGPEESQQKLDWPRRRKICIGIARGLAYLHEESRLKIVHRDIKPTNVLLDQNLNPKISDFGLAKLDEEDGSHMSTRIAGTYGYMAPEYAMHGHLNDKADVYSFGIVALEIVSGRSNSTKCRSKEESFYLLDWAHSLKVKGQLLDLVDPRIGSDCNKEEVTAMINVALLCTNPTAAARPRMSSVVSMLEGRADFQEFITDSSVNELNVEAMKKLYRQIEESDYSQTKSMLAEGQWPPSTSAADLYLVNRVLVIRTN